MTPIEAALAKIANLREAEKRMTPGKMTAMHDCSSSITEAGVYVDGLRLATMLRTWRRFAADANANGIAALRNAAGPMLDLLEALLEERKIRKQYWQRQHPEVESEYGNVNYALGLFLAAFVEGED